MLKTLAMGVNNPIVLGLPCKAGEPARLHISVEPHRAVDCAGLGSHVGQKRLSWLHIRTL